jgi:hypothetical protein
MESSGVRMTRRWRVAWCGSLAGCALTWPLLAGAGAGVTVYETGFENPPFANHSLLVGQDGWIAPDLFSPAAAVIATGKRAAGKQALRVHGRDLESQEAINELTGGYYDALGSYRRTVDFDTQGTQIVRISADVLVKGEKTPDGENFFSASVSTRVVLTDGDTAGAGELAISSDGHVYGHCGCENVPTMLTSVAVNLNAWHNLAVEVDTGELTYSFFLDGEYLGSFDLDLPPDPDDPDIEYTTVLRRGSLLAYAAPDSADLEKEAYAAYFDNFAIETVAAGK